MLSKFWQSFVFRSKASSWLLIGCLFVSPPLPATTAVTSTLECAVALTGIVPAHLPHALPMVIQDINGKCGPSSLAIALIYFGKLTNPTANVCLPADIVSQLVYHVGLTREFVAGRAVTLHPYYNSFLINSSANLAAAAQSQGLFASTEVMSLAQISWGVARGEVILVHWWSGPGSLDFHWSTVQAIDPLTITMRDPWPAHPRENIINLLEFASRSPINGGGYFHTVRISNVSLH